MGSEQLDFRRYSKAINSLAKRYAGNWATICGDYNELFKELIVEGELACWLALKKYKPNRGTKESTYVYGQVARAMYHYLRDRGRMIHIPAHAQRSSTLLAKCVPELPEVPIDGIDSLLDRLELQGLVQSAGLTNREDQILDKRARDVERLSSSEASRLSRLRQKLRGAREWQQRERKSILASGL